MEGNVSVIRKDRQRRRLNCTKRATASNRSGGISPLIRGGRNLSNRNVATSRLAAMLGIGSVISDSRTAVIRRNNKLIRGNLMEASGGTTADECKKGVTYSNEAIVQLYALQIFDLICGQIDRNLANYHVIVKDNKIVRIKGIDNDMAFGDLKFEDVKDGRNRIRALKKISILGMPKAMINHIMGMTPEYLKQTLGDILDEKELDCLWDRFDGVRKEISNISQNNSIMNVTWDSNLKFANKEDEDDNLRALKMLKLDMKSNTKENGNIGTMFINQRLKGMDLNKRIKDRRIEINQVNQSQSRGRFSD